MDREKTIEYMRREVACNNTTWKECNKFETCEGCPNGFPVPIIEVIKSALALLEEGEKGCFDQIGVPVEEIKKLAVTITKDASKRTSDFYCGVRWAMAKLHEWATHYPDIKAEELIRPIPERLKLPRSEMTWGDLYKRFAKEYPTAKTIDYRPFVEGYLPTGRPGIIIHMQNGDTIVYIPKGEEKTG